MESNAALTALFAPWPFWLHFTPAREKWQPHMDMQTVVTRNTGGSDPAFTPSCIQILNLLEMFLGGESRWRPSDWLQVFSVHHSIHFKAGRSFLCIFYSLGPSSLTIVTESVLRAMLFEVWTMDQY